MTKQAGYRLLTRLDDGEARLITRGGHDWIGRFREIATAIADLPCRLASIDGEVFSPGPQSISSFSDFQPALSPGLTGQMVCDAFDLPFLGGFNLRRVSLSERKKFLGELIKDASSRVQYVEHVEGDGGAFDSAGCDATHEGIIPMRANAPCQSGRTKSWLKVKCLQSDEFLVSGCTSDAGAIQSRNVSLMFLAIQARARWIYLSDETHHEARKSFMMNSIRRG